MAIFTDENGNPVVTVRQAAGSVNSAEQEHAASAQVAAAANNQTLPAIAGRRTFIAGFTVDGLGATAASVINVTISGVLGGTITYALSIPAGATAALAAPLRVEFARPIPANADNTAIVVNVPSFGAGNTQANASVHGFSRPA